MKHFASLILLALFCLLVGVALGEPITVPVVHYHRPDKWWEKGSFRKRDTAAPLNNFRPPDVWTVSVSIGTPPQALAVNIDTGSSDLLVATDACSECNTAQFGRFQFSDSSSFALLPCSDDRCDENCVDCSAARGQSCLFNDTYGDGSWAAGEVASDMIAIGNLSSTSPLTFGLIEVTVPDFYINGNISGIFGLAFASSSCWGQQSALLSLFNQNPSIPQSFSLCLLPDGGAMTIGESFSSNAIPYIWTPYTTVGVFAGYGATLQDIRVSGSSLGVTVTRPVIIDSGTTLTVLPESAFSALQTSLLNACSGATCDLLSGQEVNFLPASLAEVQALPSITLEFTGVALTLAPTQYMLAADARQDLWFFTFAPTSGVGIVGNQLMKYFRTAFDIDGQRIGFADAITTCPGGQVIAPGATVAPTGSTASPSPSATTSTTSTTASTTLFPPFQPGAAASLAHCVALIAIAACILLQV